MNFLIRYIIMPLVIAVFMIFFYIYGFPNILSSEQVTESKFLNSETTLDLLKGNQNIVFVNGLSQKEKNSIIGRIYYTELSNNELINYYDQMLLPLNWEVLPRRFTFSSFFEEIVRSYTHKKYGLHLSIARTELSKKKAITLLIRESKEK